MSDSRTLILQRIRQALKDEVPLPDPAPSAGIYAPSQASLLQVFREAFAAKAGLLHEAESWAEAVQQLKQYTAEKGHTDVRVWEEDLQATLADHGYPFTPHADSLHLVHLGITGCEALIARTGSLLVSSRQAAGRRLSIYPPAHAVLASTSQLLPDVEDGLALVRSRYGSQLPSMLSLVSGASRTADIEKTLVMGAHGPRELALFLVHDTPH